MGRNDFFWGILVFQLWIYFRRNISLVLCDIYLAIQLHDLVSYKATTYLVVTISDSFNDLGNTTIWLVTLHI